METHQSKYVVNSASIRPSSTSVSMDVTNTGTSVEYTLQITSLRDLSVRVKMDEKNPKAPRHTVKHVLPETLPESNIAVKERDENKIILAMADHVTAVIHYRPLRIDVFSKDDLVLSLNSRGLLEIEHQREKQDGDPEGTSMLVQHRSLHCHCLFHASTSPLFLFSDLLFNCIITCFTADSCIWTWSYLRKPAA